MTLQGSIRGRGSVRLSRRVAVVLLATVGLVSVDAVGAAGSAPPLGPPWVVYQVDRDDVTGRLLVGRPDGTEVTDLIVDDQTGSRDHYRPDVSPDVSTIVFEVYRPHPTDPDGLFPSELWLADIDGTNTRVLAACQAPCWQLRYGAWSPDGGSIAFVSSEHFDDGSSGVSAIEVIDVASGKRRTVAATANGMTSYLAPKWSPDGTQLVFMEQTYADEFGERLTSSRLATVDALTKAAELTYLTARDTFAWGPDWAPGASILYVQTVTEDSDDGALWQVAPNRPAKPVSRAEQPRGMFPLTEGAGGPEGDRALVHSESTGVMLERFERWPDGYLGLEIVREATG